MNRVSRMNRLIANVTITVSVLSFLPHCGRNKSVLDPPDIVQARFVAVSRLSAPLSASMLIVTLSERHRAVVFFGADFRPDSALVVPHSEACPTGTSGEIGVSFVISDSTGGTAASGEVRLPLSDDWEWRVTFTNSERDPTRYCMGCRGSEAFALSPSMARSDSDSLWVYWGGNYISHPVVY